MPRVLAVVLGLLLLLVQVSANGASYIKVGNVPDVNFGVWENSGSWSTTVTNCIASASKKNPEPGAVRLPYNAKVTNDEQNDGFYLYLDGDKDAVGNERILISFAHRDIALPSAGFENLVNDQYDSHLHLGQFDKCLPGINSELRIDISGSELASKVNGEYEGKFVLSARNFDNDDDTNFDVMISIQRGTEVRVSRLNPVNFGQHSGVGNLARNERMCIYSNAASGSYRLSINSASKDAAGNFYLKESVTGELIPMAVRFSDSGAGTATFPMLNNYFRGIGNNDRDDCRGVDNATMSLFLNEADLQAASTGNYRETLILLVEPE